MIDQVKVCTVYLIAIFTFCNFDKAFAETGYKLGVGDVVQLSVYGQPDLSLSLRVDSNGALSVPLLGNVVTAGHTSADTAKRIAQGLEGGGFLQKAHVNVLVTEYRSQSVSVLGMVNRPGRLFLDGPITLHEAIAWAGGITSTGNQRVTVLRVDSNGRQTKQEVDLQALFDEATGDRGLSQLQHGDTIYVPVADRFYVRGEVQNPGMFPLDRPMNVMQAISISGGMTDRASKNGLALFRREANGKLKEISANLDDPLQDGDVLAVKESLF